MTVALLILALFGGPGDRGGHAEVVPPARGGQALPETPVQTGQRIAARAGWVGSEWVCLYRLWSRESGWVVTKANYAGSGAYGIPQALPGSKMASAGPQWATDAATQIRWGIGYIRARYGTPCGAWSHSNAHGYY